MGDYRKFVEKQFTEMDYLKEKETTLEKRKKIMELLRPENRERLDKLIEKLNKTLRDVGQPGIVIGKSRLEREKFVKELCDYAVPPP